MKILKDELEVYTRLARDMKTVPDHFPPTDIAARARHRRVYLSAALELAKIVTEIDAGEEISEDVLKDRRAACEPETQDYGLGPNELDTHGRLIGLDAAIFAFKMTSQLIDFAQALDVEKTYTVEEIKVALYEIGGAIRGHEWMRKVRDGLHVPQTFDDLYPDARRIRDKILELV